MNGFLLLSAIVAIYTAPDMSPKARRIWGNVYLILAILVLGYDIYERFLK